MVDLSYKVASGLPYLFAASALSLLLTRLCITILPWFKLVDIPRGRHQHDRVVPRGGELPSFSRLSLSSPCGCLPR